LVKETVTVDSFFDFFSPLPRSAVAEDEEVDDSEEWERDIDFEIGEAIKDDIIPRAVTWYTGEAADDDDFDDEEDDEDDDDDDDDDEDDDDENCGCGHEHVPGKAHGRRH
jgi:nucleosome assembly protein 1-like 1